MRSAEGKNRDEQHPWRKGSAGIRLILYLKRGEEQRRAAFSKMERARAETSIILGGTIFRHQDEPEPLRSRVLVIGGEKSG